MKKNLLIFDLDGTLYDTREVNFLSYQKALAQESIQLDRNFYYKHCNGRYYKDYLPDIQPDISNIQMEYIHENKKKYYNSYLGCAVENRLLFDMIERLISTYHIALVTTASRKNALDILIAFHRSELFELILSQEDVIYKKPHPEGFLKAMAYFKIPPEKTTIFEDSDSGIAAADACAANYVKIYGFN